MFEERLSDKDRHALIAIIAIISGAQAVDENNGVIERLKPYREHILNSQSRKIKESLDRALSQCAHYNKQKYCKFLLTIGANPLPEVSAAETRAMDDAIINTNYQLCEIFVHALRDRARRDGLSESDYQNLYKTPKYEGESALDHAQYYAKSRTEVQQKIFQLIATEAGVIEKPKPCGPTPANPDGDFEIVRVEPVPYPALCSAAHSSSSSQSQRSGFFSRLFGARSTEIQ